MEEVLINLTTIIPVPGDTSLTEEVTVDVADLENRFPLISI